MTMSVVRPRSSQPQWDDLAAQLSGRVVTPGDADFVRFTTPWNVAVPSDPAAVVEVASADDVVAAIRFARAHDLNVDVRATGHGAAVVDRSTLLVHTGGLDEITVHPEGWARVGAGVRWTELLAAAAPYGLAPLCGSAPHVGVVGYLTGGGLGPVARTFGFASDHVRAFEVVTGDGVLRHASPTQNPALFWGLRGGKGALGIVTAVEIDLKPVADIYGGGVYFDASDAATIVHAWAEWSRTLPEQATTSLAVLRLPDLPTLPPPLAGRCTVAVRFAWVGDPADGAATSAAIASWAPPILGGLGPMPYAAIGSIHADPVDPMPASERALLLSEFPADAVDALLSVAGADTACAQVIVELRLLGGALGRVGEHASAVCHRDAAYSLLAIGIAAPPVLPATLASAGEIAAAMASWTMPGGLPNFGGAATAASVAERYTPEVLSRLTSLAASYDPDGVLACGAALREAAGVGASADIP